MGPGAESVLDHEVMGWSQPVSGPHLFSPLFQTTFLQNTASVPNSWYLQFDYVTNNWLGISILECMKEKCQLLCNTKMTPMHMSLFDIKCNVLHNLMHSKTALKIYCGSLLRSLIFKIRSNSCMHDQ